MFVYLTLRNTSLIRMLPRNLPDPLSRNLHDETKRFSRS